MKAQEQAFHDSLRLPTSQVAGMLQETLGQRLVAYGVGLRDPKAIGSYAREERSPREETDSRLRELYQVVRILLERETAQTVRAWLIGANPLLEDKAPLELLHDRSVGAVVRAAEAHDDGGGAGREVQELRLVLQAAQDFITTGY